MRAKVAKNIDKYITIIGIPNDKGIRRMKKRLWKQLPWTERTKIQEQGGIRVLNGRVVG